MQITEENIMDFFRSEAPFVFDLAQKLESHNKQISLPLLFDEISNDFGIACKRSLEGGRKEAIIDQISSVMEACLVSGNDDVRDVVIYSFLQSLKKQKLFSVPSKNFLGYECQKQFDDLNSRKIFYKKLFDFLRIIFLVFAFVFGLFSGFFSLFGGMFGGIVVHNTLYRIVQFSLFAIGFLIMKKQFVFAFIVGYVTAMILLFSGALSEMSYFF